MVAVGTWQYIEGSIIFGNLVLENDDQATIAIIKSRIEFDKFLERENIEAQDIVWR